MAPLSIPGFWLLAVLLATPAAAAPGFPAAAQGSAADYQRAAELRAHFANKVFRERIEPIWLDGGRLLYTVRTGPQDFEVVLVDPTAAAGTRRKVLSELPQLAARLDAQGTALLTAAAGTDGRVQLLFEDGSALALDPRSLEVSNLALEDADGLRLDPANERRRNARGGARTTVLFVNRTPFPLELKWAQPSGPPKSYGVVGAGETRRMSTYAGHLWLVETPAEWRDPNQPERVTALFLRARPQAAVALLDEAAFRPRTDPRTPQDPQKPGARRTDASDLPAGLDLGAEHFRGRPLWAPGRRAFAIDKVREIAPTRVVTTVESSPRDQLQPKVHTQEYAKPGDPLPYVRPAVYRIADDGTPVAVPIPDQVFGTPWRVSHQSWSKDGQRFRFLVNHRGHQRLAYCELDLDSGEVCTLIDERSDTFIDYSQKTWLHLLPDDRTALWMSERSGWNHLYRVDLENGAIEPLTQGEWVVRAVDRVDDGSGQLWLRVMGIHPDQDPYHIHFARLDLASGALTILTDGDGTHEVEWSPDHAFFVDRWSRVDLPPVHELRNADGERVCVLERADASALFAAGWRAPQRFVAKGRDGKTDIWGYTVRPTNFDPSESYPVVENIYAGPHGAHVPKNWAVHRKEMELAELGFVVVRIDGMGTNWRSRAFHDVAWKNIADAGFPDRKLWIRALAATDPALDLSRVGIYGGSAGGQNAMRALIDHHDLYRAAVADCGCHDNRMDKVWWNEAWMGWPVDESYERSSNVVHAHRMEGALFLIVGELDRNVDPASTMQVVDALIRADKDFDLLVVPGGGHGIGESPYGTRRRRDFLVRELLGVEPRWQPAGG